MCLVWLCSLVWLCFVCLFLVVWVCLSVFPVVLAVLFFGCECLLLHVWVWSFLFLIMFLLWVVCYFGRVLHGYFQSFGLASLWVPVVFLQCYVFLCECFLFNDAAVGLCLVVIVRNNVQCLVVFAALVLFFYVYCWWFDFSSLCIQFLLFRGCSGFSFKRHCLNRN